MAWHDDVNGWMHLDSAIAERYDRALDRAAQPNLVGVVIGNAAQLQALTSERLGLHLLDLDKHAERVIERLDRTEAAQDVSDRINRRLTKVNIWLAVAATILAAVQAWPIVRAWIR
jgi:hypothetical protein